MYLVERSHERPVTSGRGDVTHQCLADCLCSNVIVAGLAPFLDCDVLATNVNGVT